MQFARTELVSNVIDGKLTLSQAVYAWLGSREKLSIGGRLLVFSEPATCGRHLNWARPQHLRKRAAVASSPKFREETPKKGSNPATPIAVLHCTI